MSLLHNKIKTKHWYEIQRYPDKTHSGFLSYIQEVDGFVQYNFKWLGEMYHTDPVKLGDILCEIPEPRIGRRIINFIKRFK